jgi:hypothetical protein
MDPLGNDFGSIAVIVAVLRQSSEAAIERHRHVTKRRRQKSQLGSCDPVLIEDDANSFNYCQSKPRRYWAKWPVNVPRNVLRPISALAI